MLRLFRDNLKHLKWVLWLVVLVFVVFLFTDFGGIPPGSGAGEAAAATVGSYEISYADFQQAYRQQEAQIAQAYGGQIDSETARQIGLPRQVMESLVAVKILLAEADRMGLRISDEEVREEILQYPVFLDESGNFIGEEEYASVLRSNRLTAASFEEAVREELLTTRVRQVLNENVYISDAEVEETYRSEAETAQIRFIRLLAADYADRVTLSPTEVEEYFASHREDFEIPEQRVIDYLMVSESELQDTVLVTDEEVAAYYGQNRDEYTLEEQVSARHILARTGSERSLAEAQEVIADARARIESGEDFGAVASEVSDDPGSKANGGDLGTFGRGQMVAPFEEAAFAAAPGSLVGPVETDFGVHLIEVLGRSEGGLQPLDQVSTSIRNRLARERAAAAAAAKAGELRDRMAREDVREAEGLAELAELTEGVRFGTSPPFGESDSVPTLGRSAELTREVFDLEEGDLGEAVQLNSGWAVFRLREIRDERLPELAEVEAEVRSALEDEKRVELAAVDLEEARRSIDEGATLDEAAQALETEAIDSGEFGADDAVGELGRATEVARAALALEVGDLGGPVQLERQAILFEVTARSHFDAATFEGEKAATRDRLVAERASELLATLIAARRDELGVEYDPAFVETWAPGS